MTCLWQHKNATQHDLGSKKPIFFNCLLDGAHTISFCTPVCISSICIIFHRKSFVNMTNEYRYFAYIFFFFPFFSRNFLFILYILYNFYKVRHLLLVDFLQQSDYFSFLRNIMQTFVQISILFLYLLCYAYF